MLINKDKEEKIEEKTPVEIKKFISGDNVKIVRTSRDENNVDIDSALKSKVFIVTQVTNDKKYIIANEDYKFKLSAEYLEKC